MTAVRRNPLPFAAFRLALGAIALSLSLAGCANPNYIGVQDFGYITGNVVDQNGKPVVNALVTSTGTTSGSAYTGTSGGFTLNNVAVGEQTLNVTANGYAPLSNAVTVIVTKDQGVSAGNITVQSILPQS